MPIPPPFRRRRLGKKLARMRATARMTLDEAARALYRTKSSLHRIEKGETILDVHLAKSMMDLYDQFDPELVDQALRAREPGWWTTYGIENQGYIDVETEAARVSDVSPTIIPGLLQTVGYMRAVFEAHRLKRTKRWLENDIRVRQIRQERLTDPDNPLLLHAVIHEAALRTVVGNREVMQEQLRHLLDMATKPNVTIQVVSYDQGVVDGMATAFTLLGFSGPDEPEVCYIEYLTGALHIEEEAELKEARMTFGFVASRAMGAEDSVALIERILAEWKRVISVSTVDLSGAVWRKSSRSNGASNANCVEVAFAGPSVGVRDSKNPGAATLAFPAVQWSFFLRHLGS